MLSTTRLCRFSVLLILSLLFYSAAYGQQLSPRPDPIPANFFGMHVHRLFQGTSWPQVQFKTWRLWDSYVAWYKIEPQKGKWDFSLLDRYVTLAEAKGVDIILPLGLSPKWASSRPTEPCIYPVPGLAAEPSNIQDWRDYVRTVMVRYKGKIKYYEIWNEPASKLFFSGTVAQLVELTKEAHTIARSVDNNIKIISPSSTLAGGGFDWFTKFMKAGGEEYVDIIGYHFYVGLNPPEAMIKHIVNINSKIHKPLWNTETGWSKPKKFTDDKEAMAFVARSYILNWAAGVDRFCWYAWDNKNFVTLRMTEDDDKTLTPAAIAYSEIQKWMVGARMESCSSDLSDTWVCKLSRDNGYHAYIIWNTSKPTQFPLQVGWNVKRIKDLKQGIRVVSKETSIEIGPSPILLENVVH